MPTESFEHRRRGDPLPRCPRVKRAPGLCGVGRLVHVVDAGLFRVRPGGQAASDWYFAMAITSTLQLLAYVWVCCCAPCCLFIFEVEEFDKRSNDEKPCALCYLLEYKGGRKGRPTSGPLLPEPGWGQWPDPSQYSMVKAPHPNLVD